MLEAIRNFFGGHDIGLSPGDLTDPDAVVQLGVAPVRIDLLCSLSGVPSFAEAWENRQEGVFGGVKAHFLSLDDLIREKRTAGRDQDKADVSSLLKAKSKK